jgi:hypothetical protein
MNPIEVVFLVGTFLALAVCLIARWQDRIAGEPSDVPVPIYAVVFLITLYFTAPSLYAYIVIPNYCEGLTIWDLEYWARGCFGMPN